MPANGLDAKEEMASTPVEREIVAPSTRLRDVVNTAPATNGISETQVASLPHVAIPTKRPLHEPVQFGKPDRSTSTASSSDVLRFDQCKPVCETRDPLVVGTTSAAVPTEATEFESQDPLREAGASALNGAGYVLTQTAALPFTALRLGRDAVIKASGLD
ncbi:MULTISPECIES: hypothetical protein [unclassified Rhizobium]|uniref:hypothetical protein n=1 Tax=unclassified Rhizobium TaxID=2613769 RepID=UPI002478B507|nr:MULTISPECIES: hypothetical protein [unclassified Rhizobium]